MRHYQAIVTKYHGPTNTRGARVRATAEAGHVTLSWDHALGVTENHAAAARALAEKFGWTGVWFMGGLNAGFVFVNAPEPFGVATCAFVVAEAAHG